MKTGSSKNESPPQPRLCGPVCGLCSRSKETTPRSIPAPVGPFLWDVGEGRIFFEPVWVSQASETEIPFTNQPNLTSSITCFIGRFPRKTEVTHRVENEAG